MFEVLVGQRDSSGIGSLASLRMTTETKTKQLPFGNDKSIERV
jgi:hypothetical protein